MTDEIHGLLEIIKANPIFEVNDYFFVGGTALSYYLNHRISYDIDIASTKELPIAQIKSFVYSIGGRAIADKDASKFKINTGQSIERFHMKFMVDGIKLEFTYFKHEIQKQILQNASYQLLDDASTLRILSLKDISLLKFFALFNRQKTRDLFDASIILEKDLLSINEVENLYSFIRTGGVTIRDYIKIFNSLDDNGDNTLDFMGGQEHFKTFRRKEQSKRLSIAKEMFITQFDAKQKELLSSKQKEAKRFKTLSKSSSHT